MSTDRHIYYHDDPVPEEEQDSKFLRNLKILLFIVVLAFAPTFIKSTLAANVTLNSGTNLEFGQGTVQTAACSGNSLISVNPISSFVNESGGGAYKVGSIKVDGVPSSCYGSQLRINLYDDSSSSPLAIYNSSRRDLIAYNHNGTFKLVGGNTGISLSARSGGFTATFDSPLAQSSLVSKVTVQSEKYLGEIKWTMQSAASNILSWTSVTYGNGIFVAVSTTGTGNRVMTSPDGITWTSRTTPDLNWYSVTFGNNLFVAVAATGTANQVMTSPDGVTWTSRTTPGSYSWRGIAYGNGMYVAVADNGTGTRVMTSPDGITWTSRTSAADLSWNSVSYGNGVFVAVASSGTGNRVMTSPDGITWTSRTSAADLSWNSVAFGNNTFVAVATTGSGNRVMTSPDGITWTSRTSTANNNWLNVAYCGDIFVAVSNSGDDNRIMTSYDGIDWLPLAPPAIIGWRAVGYGNGIFVAVANTGVPTRVMSGVAFGS